MKNLRHWLKSKRKAKFQYGTWDCLIAVAEWITFKTGRDYKALVCGYQSSLEAYRKLEQDYGGSLIACLHKHLPNPIHPNLAQRGDVGVLIIEGREICAIRDAYCWWVSCEQGMMPLVLGQYTEIQAWRIE